MFLVIRQREVRLRLLSGVVAGIDFGLVFMWIVRPPPGGKKDTPFCAIPACGRQALLGRRGISVGLCPKFEIYNQRAGHSLKAIPLLPRRGGWQYV